MMQFERHLQTGATSIGVALLVWVGVSISTLQQDVAVLKTDMRYLKEAIMHVEETAETHKEPPKWQNQES